MLNLRNELRCKELYHSRPSCDMPYLAFQSLQLSATLLSSVQLFMLHPMLHHKTNLGIFGRLILVRVVNANAEPQMKCTHITQMHNASMNMWTLHEWCQRARVRSLDPIKGHVHEWHAWTGEGALSDACSSLCKPSPTHITHFFCSCTARKYMLLIWTVSC